MLSVRNLYKRFGKFVAVNDISFDIEEGYIYGFVGANGAGKTTTLKILACIMDYTSGTVTIDGIDIKKNPMEVKKKIGYMPDFFGVYDDLKTYEYMDFYSGVYGIPLKERKKIIFDLLELVNLEDKLDFYVENLSRGMKQRLCLARALIHDPKLLILDEPASGLDPKARIEMKEILKALSNMNKTIIISSHILPELSELCNAVGIIDKGKMIASGTVEEILKKLKKKKTVRIKTIDDNEKALKVLNENPSIQKTNLFENYIEVVFDGDNELIYNILKSLIVADVKVISFNELSGNLESIFIQITMGEESNGN